jgi:transcriptional regulator with XRE-family HTH domain
MALQKIKELRIQKKLTQADMAEVLNISQNAYCLIENGTTRLLDNQRIKLIAEKLEVNPVELALFDDLGITKESAGHSEMLLTLKNELEKKNSQIEQLLWQNKQLIAQLMNKIGGGYLNNKKAIRFNPVLFLKL